MTEREALKLALEALENNKQTHYYCEDTWYSCPQHEDGCANDSVGDECNCGADQANAEIDKAITAIKEALAQPVRITWDERGVRTVNGVPDDAQPKQEPVAWYDPTNGVVSADKNDSRFTQLGQVLPLYPQRTWVGLTDEEIEQLHTAWVLGGGFKQLCDAIEAKLKEKNT